MQNGGWRSLASALEWGSRGREFKSLSPEKLTNKGNNFYGGGNGKS